MSGSDKQYSLAHNRNKYAHKMFNDRGPRKLKVNFQIFNRMEIMMLLQQKSMPIILKKKRAKKSNLAVQSLLFLSP